MENDLTLLAKESLAKDEGFIKSNNYKVIKVADNYCELEANITKEALNPYGSVHGGFLFGIADTAAGIAAISSGCPAVTVDSTITYLNRVTGTKIKAVCSLVKKGRTLAFYEVKIYDDKGQLCVNCSLTYCFLNSDK